MAFPIEVIKINGHSVSLFQLMREGRYLKAATADISAVISGTVNFNTAFNSASLAVYPGRSALVTSLIASCVSGPVQIQSQSALGMKTLGVTTLGQNAPPFNVVFGANGGQAIFNPMVLLGSEGNFDILFRWLGADGAAKPYSAGSIGFIDFTADYCFDAKKKVLVIGESTSWASMGNDPAGVAYPGEALWNFRVVNHMRKAGKSVRLINKAFGGMSSNTMEYARRSNFYDVEADLYMVNLGVNDAQTSTSGLGVVTPEATFKANLANIIVHRNTFNRDAKIVFISTFPTSVNVANYRQWIQDVANNTAIGGGQINNVYFIDASTAFTLNAVQANDVNFTNPERTSGARVHPSGAGHELIADKVIADMQNMTWFDSF